MQENQTFIPFPYQTPPQFHSFWFEVMKESDDADWKKFMGDNARLPFYVAVVYLTSIFGLQKWMEKRNALDLSWALVVWNLALGLFSICGAIRMGQELVAVLRLPSGFHRSICSREGYNQPAAFWGLLFTLSKFVELGDTYFIVLRKQRLIVLQWYHHFLTMIFVWQVVPFSEPIQRWYGVLNYSVHGLMYPYFALRALKVHVPRGFAVLITSLQLGQMIVAISVNIYSIYVLANGEDCARHPVTIKWAFAAYSSFAILFIELFFSRYVTKSDKKKTV